MGSTPYVTLLAPGNKVCCGSYPAVYYYRNQRKIFVVYGQSRNTPNITWDNVLNPESRTIYQCFLDQGVQEALSFTGNYAKACFDAPNGILEQVDVEAIASALKEVIKEYAAIYTAPTYDNSLYSLIDQFIRTHSNTMINTRYSSQNPSINFEINMLPCSRGIAYLTMLAYGNETGFGIYPAVYIYRQQRKLLVVYGQSNANPPIIWEKWFASHCVQHQLIHTYFNEAEIKSIKRTQPQFNYLDNHALASFDLPEGNINNETVAKISAMLQEVIQFYGEYYKHIAKNNFEDAKVHQTLKDGVKVRSKSEVIIANMLYERNIPFEYEKPATADDRSFLPDFTIKMNDKIWYWEHLGMLAIKEYREHWEEKRAWYEKHFPGQLITTEESAQLSVDADLKIRKFFTGGS
jgi:hypothetical protein